MGCGGDTSLGFCVVPTRVTQGQSSAGTWHRPPQPCGSHPASTPGRSSRSISGGPQASASSAPTALLAASEPCCAAAKKPQAMGQEC